VCECVELARESTLRKALYTEEPCFFGTCALKRLSRTLYTSYQQQWQKSLTQKSKKFPLLLLCDVRLLAASWNLIMPSFLLPKGDTYLERQKTVCVVLSSANYLRDGKQQLPGI